MKNVETYCIHCWPTKRVSHFVLHFDYYNEKLVGFFFKPFALVFLSLSSRARDIIWGSFLELLALVGVIKFTDTPDESKIHDRSLMFFKEAKARGIKIQVAEIPSRHRYGNDYRFWYKGKKYYYEGVPLAMFAPAVEVDNKVKVKNLLKSKNIPVADGKLFLLESNAIRYSKKIGYPLVVKPNSGSLSMHVTLNIKNEKELTKAISVAKIFRPDFIVEKFILGDLFRATVFGKKEVLVCERRPTSVLGDGVHTVNELIDIKNQSENRTGDLRVDGTMAFGIDLEQLQEKDLLLADLDLSSVPKTGERLTLTKKFTPETGNDIIVVTEQTHPENKRLFLRVAEILGADIVGMDVVCEDITKPFTDQTFAIIETNSIPYTNVHQYPSEGKAEPVAKMVWDMVLERLG